MEIITVVMMVVETQYFASLRDAPMPEQLQTVDELTDKVNAHLKKMGSAWN